MLGPEAVATVETSKFGGDDVEVAISRFVRFTATNVRTEKNRQRQQRTMEIRTIFPSDVSFCFVLICTILITREWMSMSAWVCVIHCEGTRTKWAIYAVNRSWKQTEKRSLTVITWKRVRWDISRFRLRPKQSPPGPVICDVMWEKLTNRFRNTCQESTVHNFRSPLPF